MSSARIHAQLEQKSSFAETGKSVSLQHDSCLSRALVSSRALAVPAELERLGWLLPDSPRRRVAARRVAARRRSSRRRSSRARSTLYARRTRSSRPSMALNFRASSTRNTLHDADVRNTLHDDDVNGVNSDVQVHKPSRSCRKEVSRCRLTALCACAGSRDSPPDVTSRRRRG